MSVLTSVFPPIFFSYRVPLIAILLIDVVVRQLSSGCQVVVWHSSVSHSTIVRHLIFAAHEAESLFSLVVKPVVVSKINCSK